MRDFKFIKGVEKLIDPVSVGTLHFMQSFNEGLPPKTQKKLISNSAKKHPYMGFVIEPYSYYLCYEIKEIEAFEKELPDGFELTKTHIFDQDEAKYYFIIGCFNARTSGFFGSRIEGYLIAKDSKTNKLSWVIIDYDTNTISYDEKNGLSKPNSLEGFVTSDYQGNVIVDMKNDQGRNLNFSSLIKNGKLQKLDNKLWIDGNLSIAYGKKLSNSNAVFSLRFDPQEMDSALNISLDDLEIKKNDWYKDVISDIPTVALCFPYAQHFLSDSPGHFSNLQSKEELVKSIDELSFDNVKPYSSTSFRKLIILIPTILLLIIVILIILLVFK